MRTDRIPLPESTITYLKGILRSRAAGAADGEEQRNEAAQIPFRAKRLTRAELLYSPEIIAQRQRDEVTFRAAMEKEEKELSEKGFLVHSYQEKGKTRYWLQIEGADFVDLGHEEDYLKLSEEDIKNLIQRERAKIKNSSQNAITTIVSGPEEVNMERDPATGKIFWIARAKDLNPSNIFVG